MAEPITITMDGTIVGTMIVGEKGGLCCTRLAIEQVAGKAPCITLDLESGALTASTDKARYRVADPEGGLPREVRRIEFADGGEWVAP